MKKHISNHLRMATIVMGITLATTAMADVSKDSVKNDLLCVTLNDGATDALAILQVEKNGLAHGVVCYLDLDSVDDAIDNCNLVTGQALKSYDGNPRYLDISLVGAGLDGTNLRDATQTDAAINFAHGEAVGYGVAATITSARWPIPWYDNLADGDAHQTACRTYPDLASATPRIVIIGTGINRNFQTETGWRVMGAFGKPIW